MFVTQYKNDNTPFHRSSALAGGLGLELMLRPS